jgi:1,4-dihydroxy-2-naphthoate octaprenyltransferase
MDGISQIAVGVFFGNIATVLVVLSVKSLWHVEKAEDASWGALAASAIPLLFIAAILLANLLRVS